MKRIHIMHNLMDDVANQPEERGMCQEWSWPQRLAVGYAIVLAFIMAMQVVPGN